MADPLPPLSSLAAPVLIEREWRGLVVNAADFYNCRYDPCDAPRPVVFDDVEEDRRGVAVRRHPEMILADECPHLLGVLDAFRAGQTRVTADDWETLAAPTYDAKLVLSDCYERNAARRWKKEAQKP